MLNFSFNRKLLLPPVAYLSNYNFRKNWFQKRCIRLRICIRRCVEKKWRFVNSWKKIAREYFAGKIEKLTHAAKWPLRIVFFLFTVRGPAKPVTGVTGSKFSPYDKKFLLINACEYIRWNKNVRNTASKPRKGPHSTSWPLAPFLLFFISVHNHRLNVCHVAIT